MYREWLHTPEKGMQNGGSLPSLAESLEFRWWQRRVRITDYAVVGVASECGVLRQRKRAVHRTAGKSAASTRKCGVLRMGSAWLTSRAGWSRA